ncbi:MAG TPA: hypothetical protein VFD84_09485 [Candidatus Binatia bacterium]|nr:hypothetical protein [Candidatus Binatia bacterium]
MCSERRRSRSAERNARGTRGVSLLEALGATAILSAALLGLASGSINLTRSHTTRLAAYVRCRTLPCS